MLLTTALVLALAQDSQMGARSRALGGGGTAFEDDVTSVWLNPAGIATQPSGSALSYQSYAVYEEDDAASPPRHVPARMIAGEPSGLPSYLGAVFKIGTEERPQALGICVASPIFVKRVFDAEDDVDSPNVWGAEQSFVRIRLAYARDFRFRPVGEEGWLPHLAIGFGADIARTSFRMEDLFSGRPASGQDSDTDYGGGVGLLLGLYDDTRTLKVNLGLSYQSKVEFDLKVVETLDALPGPTLNWPDQIQVGAQVFLLEGLPLRLTLDVQILDWKAANSASELPGIDGFSTSKTFSAGAEVRLPIGASAILYPRMGFRLYDAPWDSRRRADLPANGDWQLSISARDDRFLAFTAGVGLAFALSGGATATIDAAFDVGSEAPGAAIGVGVSF